MSQVLLLWMERMLIMEEPMTSKESEQPEKCCDVPVEAPELVSVDTGACCEQETPCCGGNK